MRHSFRACTLTTEPKPTTTRRAAAGCRGWARGRSRFTRRGTITITRASGGCSSRPAWPAWSLASRAGGRKTRTRGCRWGFSPRRIWRARGSRSARCGRNCGWEKWTCTSSCWRWRRVQRRLANGRKARGCSSCFRSPERWSISPWNARSGRSVRFSTPPRNRPRCSIRRVWSGWCRWRNWPRGCGCGSSRASSSPWTPRSRRARRRRTSRTSPARLRRWRNAWVMRCSQAPSICGA